MKSVILLTFTFMVFSIYRICAAGLYNKYIIYNVYPVNDEHHSFLQNLYKKKDLDVIFTENPCENDVVQILVNRNIENDFLARNNEVKISIRKLTDNAQMVFNEQTKKKSAMEFRSKTPWESILTLEEIYQWLNETAAKHPYTKLVSIGKSAENRDIFAFSITLPPRPDYDNLKVIIEGAIHGNEWLATASSIYMIDQVLNASEGSPYDTLKKRFFLNFVPIVNPDGYEYSQKVDRLWKKNRRSTGSGTFGVNLNRNFDYKFGEHDSSEDLKSQYYKGPKPFSEPETTAYSEYVNSKSTRLTFYFSLHGHGQKFIIPYGDSVKHSLNYHEVQTFVRKALNAMAVRTGREFKIGIASQILGKKYTGDSASWVKKTYHVPFTITVQHRDYDDMGIAFQSDEILPACREISEGLTELMLSTGRYQSLKNNAAFLIVTMHIAMMIISVLILTN